MTWTSPLGSPRTTPLTSEPPEDTLWSPMTPECKVFDVASYTIIGGPICCFGIIGNFLSYLVLNRTKDPKYYKDNKTIVTSFLLSALAVADALLSMAAIPLYVLQPLSFYQATHNSSVRYLWPMYQMPYTGAVLLTVLVSFNRYMAACRPFSGTGSDLAASRKHVIAVVVFSVLYNIPRFFEYQKETHFNAKLNVTEEMFSLSPLGSNTLYRVIYCNILYFLLIHGGPLICLSFLNYKLLTALKERHRRKEKLRGGSLATTKATKTAVAPCADKNKNGLRKACPPDDETAMKKDVAMMLRFDPTLKKSLSAAPQQPQQPSPSPHRPESGNSRRCDLQFSTLKESSPKKKSIKSPPIFMDSDISKQGQRSFINRFPFPAPTSQQKPPLSLSTTYFGRFFLTKSLPERLEHYQRLPHPKDIRHSCKTDLSTDHHRHSEPSVARLLSKDSPYPGWMTSYTNTQICGGQGNEKVRADRSKVVETPLSQNVVNVEVDVRLDGHSINRIDQFPCAERHDPATSTSRAADAIIAVTATVKTTGKDQQRQKQDLTFVLIVVVFTFIICHTPAFVDTILWTILDGSQKSCGRWLFYYTAIADILVMFNSSANFAIYVLTSPRFRSDLISYLSIGRFKDKNKAP